MSKNTNKYLDRFLRKIVPSTSLLTHNFFFKCFANMADMPARILVPEFRNLPPNHLRIRIGVGNRIFSNQMRYLNTYSFWMYCLSQGYITPNSSIIDIGCGCGRYAHSLRDYEFKQSRFTGRYLGVDIDQEQLKWCSENFDAPRFRFVHSTHASKSYNTTGSSQSVRLPEEDQSVDFVFSNSLLTHLLETELRNYLQETFRVLKPGGHMLMTCFCLDYPPATMGSRHTFSHPIENAWVESLEVPEAAVAYTEAFFLETAKGIGFRSAKIIGVVPNTGEIQSIFLTEK
jgi:SAM-dependent methyltransferase